MADVRINIFDSLKLAHSLNFNALDSIGTLLVNGVHIPGSISFNNVVMPISRVASNVGRTFSVSFGLYSLNVSTLSLANSASFSETRTAGEISWYTLATSAAQDITPGNWYFGVLRSTSGDSQFRVAAYGGFGAVGLTDNGVFVRGYMSVTTGALPASIATTDMLKEPTIGTGGHGKHPYVIISA